METFETKERYGYLEGLSPSLDAKDTEKVLSFLTDDCVFQAGNLEPVKGKKAIAETLNGFFPVVKIIEHEMSDTFESGDSVVHRGIVTYTRLDDTTLTVPVCDVFKMRDNKIAEYYIYIDWSNL